MKKKFSFFGLTAVIFFLTVVGLWGVTETAKAAVDQSITTSLEEINENYMGQSISLPNGTEINVLNINGPPKPPDEFAAERTASMVPAGEVGTRGVLTSFPSYSWVFGCSAVSQAMIAAYYDNNGYPDMYTGPTNGGVMPLTDTSWPTWQDSNLDWYPNNPLVASKDGVDGRSGLGSIDDYWVSYESTADDPYITGVWTQHAWGTAVGDYMKTSQSAYYNVDGSTNFYLYESNVPLTCSDMEYYGIQDLDGTYGRKLFYEARGYTVTDCYFQLTDNQYSGGFSLADFQAEIDAGHPVMLGLTGHSVVGYGYGSGSTIYIRDTWDSDTSHIYTMEWGSSYMGVFDLMAASVVNLAPLTIPPSAFSKSAPTDGAIGVSSSPTLDWDESSGADEYEYCYDDTDNSSCSVWASTGTSTSVGLSGLNAATTYYWQVRATNTYGLTYANGSETSYWSFTTEDLPGAFGKSSPSNGAPGQSTDPTLSWGSSSEADEYEYCYDDTDDSSCTGWVSVGSDTSVGLSGLSPSTTYYWHVRANNSVGTTYANGSPISYWSFTTEGIPGQFAKLAPADGAIEQSTSPTLSWETSTEADEYEYCYDDTDDSSCSGWVSTGTNTSVGLSGLDPATTYYWQVRAINSVGGVYANSAPSAFWKFTTTESSDVFLPLIMK